MVVSASRHHLPESTCAYDLDSSAADVSEETPFGLPISISQQFQMFFALTTLLQAGPSSQIQLETPTPINRSSFQKNFEWPSRHRLLASSLPFFIWIGDLANQNHRTEIQYGREWLRWKEPEVAIVLGSSANASSHVGSLNLLHLANQKQHTELTHLEISSGRSTKLSSREKTPWNPHQLASDDGR